MLSAPWGWHPNITYLTFTVLIITPSPCTIHQNKSFSNYYNNMNFKMNDYLKTYSEQCHCFGIFNDEN